MFGALIDRVYRADEIVGQNVARIYGGEAGSNEVLREMRKRGGTVSAENDGAFDFLRVEDNLDVGDTGLDRGRKPPPFSKGRCRVDRT